MANEWMDGYQWGYLHGLEAGLERGGDERDAEWNARFGEAVRIVHAAAKWPDASRESRMERMRAAEREINERLDTIRAQQATVQAAQEGQAARASSPPEPF